MKIKRINALLAIITGLLLALHIIITSMLYLGLVPFTASKIMGHMLAAIAAAHMLLSIYIVFIAQRTYLNVAYKKNNLKTIIQRASAVILLLLLKWHIGSFKAYFSGEPVSEAAISATAVFDILFFGAALLHFSVSFSKALLCLGYVEDDKKEKTINIAVYAASSLLYILSSFLLCRFLAAY